jgi:hypothetical protein
MPYSVLGAKPCLEWKNARYPKEVGGPLIARVSAPQEPDHTVGQQPQSNPKHHFHEYRSGRFVPRAHRQGAKTSGPCHGSQDRGDCVFVFHATSCCSGSAAATQNRLCPKVSASLICFNLYQVEKTSRYLCALCARPFELPAKQSASRRLAKPPSRRLCMMPTPTQPKRHHAPIRRQPVHDVPRD